jgi:tetratricopeptide (TPR) repeat protein
MSLPPAAPATHSSPSNAADPAAEKAAELAALIAELRGLRRDLGEASGGAPARSPTEPKTADPSPAVIGPTDPIPLPAGFAEIEAELSAARAAADDEKEDRLLLNATNQLIEAGHYAIAERLALRMVEIAGNDPSDVPIAYGQLGLAQYRLGKFPEALASYERAVSIYRPIYDRMTRLPDSPKVKEFRSGVARLLGLTLMRVGNVHKEAKSHQLARASYDEARAVFEAHERHDELMTLLLNYGGLESIHGNYAPAIGHLNRGLALAHQVANAEKEAEFLVNLGNAYSRSGNNQAALEHYRLAGEKVTPDSNYDLRSALLVNWSTSLLEEGGHAEAREKLLDLQAIARPYDAPAKRVLEFLPALNKALGELTAAPRSGK